MAKSRAQEESYALRNEVARLQQARTAAGEEVAQVRRRHLALQILLLFPTRFSRVWGPECCCTNLRSMGTCPSVPIVFPCSIQYAYMTVFLTRI